MAVVERRRQGRQGEKRPRKGQTEEVQRSARRRRRGIWLLAGVVLPLICSPHAGAVELTDANGFTLQPYQRWADRSAVPTVQAQVRLQLGDGCQDPAFDGCAFAVPLSIILEPAGQRRELLLHELGHIFDYLVMGGGVVTDGRVVNYETLRTTTPARAGFAHILGRQNLAWTNYSRKSLVEAFAEAYAHCALGDHVKGGRERFGHGYNPTSRQHRQVCRLIRTTAGSWNRG